MRDPERMLPIVREMRDAVDGFLAAQPAAFRTSWETPWFTGTPAFPDRMDPLLVTRYEMADFARQAQALGVQFIGACCGAIGSHIREMARALGKLDEEEVWPPDPDAPMSETEHNWDRRGRRAPGQAGDQSRTEAGLPEAEPRGGGPPVNAIDDRGLGLTRGSTGAIATLQDG